MCTCYMWMSQVVVRVVESAMERVPEIVMVAIVCQSLNPSQKQVHMRYVSPPIHGEWNETLYARSPDPSALFFARRVWLARLRWLTILKTTITKHNEIPYYKSETAINLETLQHSDIDYWNTNHNFISIILLTLLQARTQGGFRWVHLNPPLKLMIFIVCMLLKLKCLYIHIFLYKCIQKHNTST